VLAVETTARLSDEVAALEARARAAKASVKGLMNHAGKVTRELAEFAADLDRFRSTAQEAQDDGEDEETEGSG
jgi:hypothetical protein